MKVPITFYADFECFTKQIDTCQPDPGKRYTKNCQKHEPSVFCYCNVCDGKKLEPVLYTKQAEDENIAQIFVDRIQKDIEQV